MAPSLALETRAAKHLKRSSKVYWCLCDKGSPQDGRLAGEAACNEVLAYEIRFKWVPPVRPRVLAAHPPRETVSTLERRLHEIGM